MDKYKVDFARYWSYTVEAETEDGAEQIAYELFLQEEGKYARYDEVCSERL